MQNILFIHQSAELYGSDKTLLYLVANLDKNKFFPIVILPDEGPLKIELEKENVKVIIAPVLKLYRKMFTPGNLLKFINDYFKGPVTAVAVFNYYKEGQINLKYAAIIAVFFVVGSIFGSKFALTLDQKLLKKIFAVVLLVIAGKMLLDK